MNQQTGGLAGIIKGVGWGLMAVIPAAGALTPLWGLFMLAGVTGDTEHPFTLVAGFWLLLLWFLPLPITGALMAYGAWGARPAGRERAKRVALGMWKGIGVATVLVIGGVLLLPRGADNSRVMGLLVLDAVATALVIAAVIGSARSANRGPGAHASAR